MKTKYAINKEELSKSLQDIQKISKNNNDLIKAAKQNKSHLVNSEIEKLFADLVP